ncbi:MAG TPA: hypothetical protein VF524_07930, partial [Polyangia bacterium]
MISVDSLADPIWLEALGEAGRLKNGDNPVGFTPGEAAVVAYVTSTENLRIPAIGIVNAIAFGNDSWKYGDQGA